MPLDEGLLDDLDDGLEGELDDLDDGLEGELDEDWDEEESSRQNVSPTWKLGNNRISDTPIGQF